MFPIHGVEDRRQPRQAVGLLPFMLFGQCFTESSLEIQNLEIQNEEMIMGVEQRKCSACPGKTNISVGQRPIGDKLYWFASHRCDECGEAVEEDGVDVMPQAYRDQLLREEGEWGLYLSLEQNSPARIMTVLRAALEVPLSTVHALITRIPGPVLTGTRLEMLRIECLLKAQGQHASVQRLG